MLKTRRSLSAKRLQWFALVSVIGAALIFGPGLTSVQAAKKEEGKKLTAALVDLNSATQKELESVKGIGPATAAKIIKGRPYKSVDELSKAGLSAKAIEAVKPFVTVGKAPAAAAKPLPTAATVAAPATKAVQDVKATAKATAAKAPAASAKILPGTKVNINRADKAQLEALPEIGPVKAQAIIDGRPYKQIEDVMKISGIKQKTFDKIKDMISVQ